MSDSHWSVTCGLIVVESQTTLCGLTFGETNLRGSSSFRVCCDRKFDSDAKASHQAADLSLSLLITLDLITLVNLRQVGSLKVLTFLLSAISSGCWGGTLLFCLGLFGRNQRHMRPIVDHVAFHAREKYRLWSVGSLQLILSFIVVVASNLLIEISGVLSSGMGTPPH